MKQCSAEQSLYPEKNKKVQQHTFRNINDQFPKLIQQLACFSYCVKTWNSIQFKRESWVEGGCDVIQSNNATARRHDLFQGKHRQKQTKDKT